MSAYSDGLKARIAELESLWDMSEPANARQIRRMKRNAWWRSGPRTAFSALCGMAVGLGLFAILLSLISR